MYYSMQTIAENEHELQATLNAMFSYFKYWDLEVNPSKTKITFLATRSFKTPHHLSTMVIISRSMIVLYTRELYFPATFFSSKKIARDCLVKLARLCIRSCTCPKRYFCLLTFNYNFLTAWWLQFYYMDRKLLASKKVIFVKVYFSNLIKLS